MKRIPIHQVDAFTQRAFGGNPAAICPLEEWLPDATMQSIAIENNLSETAFLVPRAGEDNAWDLRWFTPGCEVDLCGHATLATSFVLFEEDPSREELRFHTRVGWLEVARKGELMEMDFPAQPGEAVEMPAELAKGLGGNPEHVLRNQDYWLAVYGTQEEVAALAPDMNALAKVQRGFVATAPANTESEADFVSRMFAPYAGVPEDPVCGSAHCLLAPYWAQRLEKTNLHAHQISARGGVLHCELRGERVAIAGNAVKTLEGSFFLPAEKGR